MKRSSRANPHEIRLFSGCPYYFTLPIAEGRIVVVAADTGIKADTINDLLSVQTLALCVGVQFVEVSHAQGKICVCEQLNSLCLGEAHEQGVDVLLDGAFLQQTSKLVCCFDQPLIVQVSANDDTRRIQVIIESLRWLLQQL